MKQLINRKVFFKIVDIIAILVLSIMIFKAFIHSIDHVAIIKNLPVDMDPTEKETLYQSLMQ